jgi:hypothetical protein
MVLNASVSFPSSTPGPADTGSGAHRGSDYRTAPTGWPEAQLEASRTLVEMYRESMVAERLEALRWRRSFEDLAVAVVLCLAALLIIWWMR